jgi:hypothetical protein
MLAPPLKADDSWSRLAHWVVMEPGKRTIGPNPETTYREIAEQERDFGSKSSLESALRYDPTVPLARLLLAKFEIAPRRAAFLRNYDLKRLPDNAAIWVRASSSLLDQEQPKLALAAAQKALRLAPKLPDAQRALAAAAALDADARPDIKPPPASNLPSRASQP